MPNDKSIKEQLKNVRNLIASHYSGVTRITDTHFGTYPNSGPGQFMLVIKYEIPSLMEEPKTEENEKNNQT